MFNLRIILGLIIVLWSIFSSSAENTSTEFKVTYPIVEMADKTTMTEMGRRLFYSFQPALVGDRGELRSLCLTHADNRENLLYGCYNPNSKRIYISDILDKRLQGAKETTTAHELLHGVYLGLSATERQRIDKLVSEASSSLLKEESFIKRIEAYKNRDSNVLPGELHSILGSEISELSLELEKHYAKYFKNRKAIVSLAMKLNSAFINREKYIKEYDKEIDRLRLQIEINKKLLDNFMKDIDDDRNNLSRLKNSGNFEEYNRGVEPFNARVARFREIQLSANAIVDKFNETARLRNSIASEHQELIKEINESKIGTP